MLRQWHRATVQIPAGSPACGGGMRVAPDASLTSGELEICILGEIGTLGFIRAFSRVFRGTHVTHPAVTMLRGREIVIDADRPMDLMGDGERLGQLPAGVSVMPGAIWVSFGAEGRGQGREPGPRAAELARVD